MSTQRRWQIRPSAGSVIDHPSVLTEAQRSYDGVRPQKRQVDGLVIITYSRTRVYLDREAWEMLPTGGVLLMRVRPTGETPYALAMTSEELERTFGEVRQSASWETARHWSFASYPPAADAFRIDGLGTSAPPVTREVARPEQRRSVHPQQVRVSETVKAPEEATGKFGAWASWWYKRLGASPESEAYLNGVAAWRRAWRPPRVKALLLAESHVAQRVGDAGVRVRTEALGIDGLPDHFVRLVYCLGYGESQLCIGEPRPNAGTIQYWDILGQVARGENQPRKGSSALNERVRWKIAVLQDLQEQGIWLQDASPLGVYLGSGRRVDPTLYEALLRDGYQNWVWPTVADDRPEKVWVIGKGVGAALRGLPGIDPERVIVQPQGDRGTGLHRQGLKQMRTDLAIKWPD